LVILARPALVAFRPSFSLDYSSWHATHIVLVMTTSTDGTFEVVESWKGNLRVGERLVVPELIPSQNAIPLSGYPQSWPTGASDGVSEQIPKQPVGSRMVLFLKSSAMEQVPTKRTDKPERHGWKPSDIMDSMKASAVWLDGDQLYCFSQHLNPGPSLLLACRYSEERVRTRVAEIRGIQESMTVALAATDGEERAERLKPYVHSDVLPAQTFALEELGKTGPSGVRTIRGMLDDPAFTDEASALVKALVQAGGEAVGQELNNHLLQDVAFWKSTGPLLPQDWWNEDTTAHAPLREQYDRTYELIAGLEQTHYAAALTTATQLRDLWRSLPQLNDPSGVDQMAEECDKLIRHLQTN
jgi:hypothetical protein